METVSEGKYKFICFTGEGRKLLLRLTEAEPEKTDSLSLWTKENFKKGNILVFIGALGIAVRAIAPFCKDKTFDPAVLVIDERGTFVIPVLSGHLGGAVDAAKEISAKLSAIPVITTATDVRDEFAVDVFAKRNNLSISDMKEAKAFTARILAGKDAEFTVTPMKKSAGSLYLIPKVTVIGMGCRKGKSFEELKEFVSVKLKELGIDERSLKALVSVDKKKDEEGLIALSEAYEIPFLTYSAKTLMEQEGDFVRSDKVMEVTGADNVCERAVAAFGCRKFILKKTSQNGMTLAIGMTDAIIEE